MFRTFNTNNTAEANLHKQLLETHASWSTSYVNHIFNQIFSDLTPKPNLPRLRNIILHLKLRCRTNMSRTSGPTSC